MPVSEFDLIRDYFSGLGARGDVGGRLPGPE